MGKREYIRPTVKFWSIEELNKIEARMSGGGGGSGGIGGGSSGTGSGGDGSAGSIISGMTYGSSSNPVMLSINVVLSFANLKRAWCRSSSIAGAGYLTVTSANKVQIGIKGVGANSFSYLNPASSTYTYHVGHLGQMAYDLDIQTVMGWPDITCEMGPNVDSISLSACPRGALWSYDGLSAATANIIYTNIFVFGASAADISLALIDRIYTLADEDDDETAQQIITGVTVAAEIIAVFVETLVLKMPAGYELATGCASVILDCFMSSDFFPDVDRKLEDEIRSKAVFDSNGHALHGVAIYRAIIAGMTTDWRVDQWDDDVFYAPSGSCGLWTVIE